MGDENKVRDIVERSKKIFLRDELVNLDDKAHVYNLDAEFAKTKKNKNYLVHLVSLGFIFVLIFIAWIVSEYIQYQGRKLSVNIGDFQDVKLTELLDTVKKNENRLENVKEQMTEIQNKMQKEIDIIKNKYEKKTEALSKGSQQYRAYKEKENKEIRAVKLKYNRNLSAKQREINQVQNEMDKYDRKLQETMDKAEEMVNNFKKLHQLKMNELKEELILKYNPIFESVKLQRILGEKTDNKEYTSLKLEAFDSDLDTKKIISGAEFDKLRENINNNITLLNRLQQVPYINSVSPALSHIDYYTKAIINDYEKLWGRLAKRSQSLNSYQYALKYLAKNQTENGYIIDARNQRNISLFVNAVYKIKTGDSGYIFRAEDEYIGTIRFYWQNQELRAEIVELQKDKQILPFDKILLDYKETNLPGTPVSATNMQTNH